MSLIATPVRVLHKRRALRERVRPAGGLQLHPAPLPPCTAPAPDGHRDGDRDIPLLGCGRDLAAASVSPFAWLQWLGPGDNPRLRSQCKGVPAGGTKHCPPHCTQAAPTPPQGPQQPLHNERCRAVTHAASAGTRAQHRAGFGRLWGLKLSHGEAKRPGGAGGGQHHARAG